MAIKQCVDCRKFKKLDEFSLRRDLHRADCRSCAGEAKRLGRVTRRKIAREYVYQYLKTHPCKSCGETDPIVLQFDHVGDKRANLSEMVCDGYSVALLEDEISKCEVLCSHCHLRKTAAEQGWYTWAKSHCLRA